MRFMKRNKTVMFFSDYSSEYSGNFVSSLLALTSRLEALGAECIFVFPTECKKRAWTSKLIEDGKQVVYFDFRQGRLKKITELDKLLNAYKVDVIHAHFSFVLGLELLSFIRPNRKFIIHVHSDFSGGKESVKEQIRNKLLYGILASRATLVFVSPKYVKYNSKRAVLLLNALATKRLPCAHKSGEELRNEIGCAPSTTLVELFGWSPHVKGVDIAVESICKLVEEGHNIKLLLVCGRKVKPNNMADFIRNNTSCSGDEGFICYVEPVEDVFRYHEAADICLSASRSETFSYALLEMLSLGKRCVSSNIPGVQWAFKYAMTTPFSTENVDACACAIKKAMTDLPQQSQEVAQQVRSDYNIDHWVDQLIGIYDI